MAGILYQPVSFQQETILGHTNKRYRINTAWSKADAARYPVNDCHEMVQDSKGRILLLTNETKNNVLVYEKEDKFKLGLEAYYVSKQQLNDGGAGKPYWIAGFMAEKLWEHISLFVNLENFTDTRQTKWDTIFTGTINNPVFRDIYAPVEGFVLNGGFKLKL